jgi:integrase
VQRKRLGIFGGIFETGEYTTRKTMALTQIQIAKAQPKEKPYTLSEGHGLSLLINPTGSKLWRFKFRFDGKQKMMALGAFPEVTLKQARERHADARKSLRDGIDPMAKGQVETAKADRHTAKKVADDWFVHWSDGKDAIHATHVRNRLDRDILPVIGHLPIGEVKASHVVEIVKAVEARGALDIARRTFQTCNQIFRYAIANAISENNPAALIKPADLLKPVKAVNMARVHEKELPKLLFDIDNYKGEVLTRLGLKLAMYTAVRTSELIQAPWSEFDLDAARWEIADERMKMNTVHYVPLSRQAVEILRALRVITGGKSYVMPGEQKQGADTMSENTLLYALYRMGYQGRQTVHGFRALFSTILHEKGRKLGYTHDVIETQLAHLTGDSVSRAYNAAEHLDARTEMMQWWADYIDTQLALAQATSEV